MITRAQVDRSMFDAAMREYVKTTSKDTVDAINGKSRDLLFKAFKGTPRSVYDRHGIELYYYQRPKIITAICNKKYGKGSWDWDDWSHVFRAVVTKAMKSRSYLRSGFIKGAKQMQATVASKEVSIPSYAKKFDNIHARNTIATATKLRNDTLIEWGADLGMDARAKERILSAALQSALRVVTADIAKYLQGKFIKRAKAASA